jgi:hypothetical protein
MSLIHMSVKLVTPGLTHCHISSFFIMSPARLLVFIKAFVECSYQTTLSIPPSTIFILCFVETTSSEFSKRCSSSTIIWFGHGDGEIRKVLTHYKLACPILAAYTLAIPTPMRTLTYLPTRSSFHGPTPPLSAQVI